LCASAQKAKKLTYPFRANIILAIALNIHSLSFRSHFSIVIISVYVRHFSKSIVIDANERFPDVGKTIVALNFANKQVVCYYLMYKPFSFIMEELSNAET